MGTFAVCFVRFFLLFAVVLGGGGSTAKPFGVKPFKALQATTKAVFNGF